MPVEIIFKFRNNREKNKFLKDLADGFGEEHCQLSWGSENGVKLTEAKVIDITPWGALEEDDEEEFDDFGLIKMKGEDG